MENAVNYANLLPARRAAGDGSAALEAVFVGKHAAEFAGIPATGEEVRLPYVVCYDVSNGKINALRAYFPILALVQQLTEATRQWSAEPDG